MHIKFRFAFSKQNVLRRFGGKDADGSLGCTEERENGNKSRTPEHTYS
jgi:hypothetical protein